MTIVEATKSKDGLMERACECGYVEEKIILKLSGCNGSIVSSMLVISTLSFMLVFLAYRKNKYSIFK